MGYRIDPSEPTDVELRRVIAEQLMKGIDALRAPGGPDAEAVHDVRKRLKKARSALRLGRADFGKGVRHHANDELRRVSGDLAGPRDADSQVEAVDRLAADIAPTAAAGAAGTATAGADHDDAGPGGAVDESVASAIAVVRDLLAERAQAMHASGSLDRSTVLGAARTLEQTMSWLDRTPAGATGWDALAPGFTREYRRGRKAFASLGDEPTVDDLHEWRKRVKDLWYHQRLLRRLWAEAQRPIVDAADELADRLGADHDLGLLIAHLAVRGEHGGGDVRQDSEQVAALDVDGEVRCLVTDAARRQRHELQARARVLGERLHADRPKAWRDRHGAWWDLAARGERA